MEISLRTNDLYCTEMVTDIISGIKRQCRIKVKEKGSICHRHKCKTTVEKKDIIDTIYLDRMFRHNLMNIYNSWSEIDVSEYIELDNEMWPLSIIINTITQQLNNSNMENPYLIYPNNPFTRTPFTPNALIRIAQKIRFLNIPVNVALKLLLEQSEKSIAKYYNESLNYLDRHSILLMSLIYQHLRFMTVNYKNSQNNYTGFWVRKNKKLTKFEKLYISFNEVPYQIFNRGTIISNPYREHLKYTLKSIEIDESLPTDIEYCEYLLKV